MPMPGAPRHLVLLGLRGAGKSTIGPLVAEALGLTFIELDDRSAAAMGLATAGEAIRSKGLDAFRAAETATLADVLAQPASVIALGGGTPTAPGAEHMLRKYANAGRAMLIYLHTPVAVLRRRLREHGIGDRPSLTGHGVIDEVADIYAQRDPLYQSLASRVVETSDREPGAIAVELAAIIRG